MLEAAAIAVSYLIGSVPVAWLVGRLRRGIDIRDYGSGNVGASNVWQSVSHALVVPVGLAQAGQGFAGVYVGKALGAGDAGAVASGLAVIVAHDWNPWLGFQGGRGIGPSIGFMLALAPFDALPVFILIALSGVRFNQAPLSVAIALLVAPLAALIGGEHTAVVAGLGVVAGIAFVKRLVANGPPAPELPRPAVWTTRLLHDRDIRDRDAWVRRGVVTATDRRGG
jgi:acyl phosphate:glycerol-3-phosphate acyltransferase